MSSSARPGRRTPDAGRERKAWVFVLVMACRRQMLGPLDHAPSSVSRTRRRAAGSPRTGAPHLHREHNGGQLSRARLGVEGYTNLAVYLHELSELRIREGR